VGGAVFKTVVTEDLGQGGSIPLRLRYLQVCNFSGFLSRPENGLKDLPVDFAWT
jgi:hypothetical protein